VTALTQSDLEEEQTLVRTSVQAIVSEGTSSDRLKLTGLEILALIAAKVVLPMVSGLISRVLYDEYKNIQTKRKANAAKAAILSQTETSSEVVDDETILRDVTQTLTDEGLPKEAATNIARASLQRVKLKLAAGHPT